MSSSKGALSQLADQPTASVKRQSDGDAFVKIFAGGPIMVRINEKLAVELLEILLLFVDTSRHKNFKPSNSAALEDIGAVVISRQFDLRYVCLLWHNIVHRLARVGLYFRSKEGDYLLFNHRLQAHLSETRKDSYALQSRVKNSASAKRKRTGQWYSLADCIQSVRVSMSNRSSRDKSILVAVRNATKNIHRPCDLSLEASEYTMAAGSLVRDTSTDFEKQFPTLTFRELSLFFSRIHKMTEDDFSYVKECAGYCLSVGRETLRRLAVQLSALDGLSEDWSCESLQDLDIDLVPPGYIHEPRQWNEEKMLEEFNKQARIPYLFPRLEEIRISARTWPHIDFIVLAQLAHLRSLELSATPSERSNLQSDWRLAALPRVRTFHIGYHNKTFPMPFSEFVPNVKNLKVRAKYAGACRDLLSDIGAVENGFQHLENLSVEFDLFVESYEVWLLADVTALFAGLHYLRALSSLEFAVTKARSFEWCRPGDLSLLHVLPSQLSSATLSYCLLPAASVPFSHKHRFTYDPDIANADELFYKTWFLTVIHRLSDFPKLERFHCKIVAPNFHAVVSLAAKWSKSSSAAIADLRLADIINVSCSTDAYLRIESGQTYPGAATIKFRFTLASRPDLVDRKFSTRMFTFEWEKTWY